MTLQLVEADAPAARSLGATPAGHGLRALPWTRRTNLAIALALFIVVSALRLASDDPTTAISMFYLLPIALLAVEYGLRGGLLAATASAGLVATWIVVRDVDLDTGELASRFALLLLLGACFGLLSDRFSRASALVDDQVLYMEGLTAHGLVRLDAAGSITGWNRGAAEILGHSSADALSQPLSLVLGHGEADTLAEMVLEGALATGLWDEERWVVEKSGQRRWVAISVTPLADGGDAGFALVLRDLTARKEQELALKAKEAQLRELSQELEARVEWRTGELAAANKELEAFSYSVSHDLRAPLRAIDGYSLAILEDHGDVLPADAHADLERVRAASQRMSTLIDELLGLSRLTRRELQHVPVDLSAVGEQVARGLHLEDEERTVQVKIEQGLAVTGDLELLRLVLQNLLGNAWKFTADTENARIELRRIGSEKGHSTFAVSDNGAGFDMRYAEKLFRPFERLHRQEDYSGTGVGLTTVARVLNRHGGRIWAKGTPGKGATFFFDLPTRQEQNA